MRDRNYFVMGLIVVLLLALLGWTIFSTQKSQSSSSSVADTANSNPFPTPSFPIASSSPSSSEDAGTNSTQPTEVTLTIDSTGINPKTLAINASDTVTWVNNDTVNHQINSAPHPQHTDYLPLNSVGMLQPGDKKSLVFPTPGTYKFHDHLNPSLFGSVTVK